MLFKPAEIFTVMWTLMDLLYSSTKGYHLRMRFIYIWYIGVTVYIKSSCIT